MGSNRFESFRTYGNECVAVRRYSHSKSSNGHYRPVEYSRQRTTVDNRPPDGRVLLNDRLTISTLRQLRLIPDLLESSPDFHPIAYYTIHQRPIDSLALRHCQRRQRTDWKRAYVQ